MHTRTRKNLHAHNTMTQFSVQSQGSANKYIFDPDWVKSIFLKTGIFSSTNHLRQQNVINHEKCSLTSWESGNEHKE